MRLKRLELKAFGPFTEHSLDFNSPSPGLHIIFGLNEAGKSSALRGLKALLYGFPERTPDNFLHSYDQLLVGGCLENKDGHSLTFLRRKRRVGDLLDTEGNPLEKQTLSGFIDGVDPEVFDSLYGIDHRRLVEGGDEILSQKGEVGKILFAAGSGLSSLKEVTDQFEQEAAGLFKSAGQLPEINTSIRRFNELRKELREASLSTTEWNNLQIVLKEAESKRSELEKKRVERVKELHRLERLQQAIPELASHKVWLERLQALGTVTLLPADFSERHRKLNEDISAAQKQLYKESEKLKQKQEKRDAISLNTTLLEHSALINSYHERLGEYRKGQKDRPERNGMRINLRQEASQHLSQIQPDLPLDKVDSLRPVLARKMTIQALGSRFDTVSDRVFQAKKRVKEAGTALQEAEKKCGAVAKPRSSQGLEQAVKLALRAGDLDTLIKKKQNEAEQETKECCAELKRIGRWSGDLAALRELALPLLETVHHFEQNYKELTDTRRNLEKERTSDTQQLRTARIEITRIEYGGEIPSPEELNQTRQRREEGWHLLRRQWLDKEDVTDESRTFDRDQPLPIAYEKLVKKADLIADRLCSEADRVATAATLRSQQEGLQESLANSDRVAKELKQQETELDEAWAAIWEPIGITPLTPGEMVGWYNAIDQLRYRVNELSKKEKEIISEQSRRSELRDRIVKGLIEAGEDGNDSGSELGQLLVLAESVLERIDQQKVEQNLSRDRLKAAREEFDKAEWAAADAQDSLDNWRDQWKTAVSGFGHGEEISPAEAQMYLEALRSCLEKLKEAADLQKRIDGIDRDADFLEKEVKDLVRQVDPEMLSLSVDQAILHLREKLDRAQNDRIRYDQLGEDIDGVENELSIAAKSLEDMNGQLSELMRVAECERADELGSIIEKFNQYQQCREHLSSIEASLARIGGGASLEELVEQAAEVDDEELAGRVETLRQDIEDNLNPAINRISQEIGEINNQLKTMDGGSRAAEVREKIEQELARMRRLSEQYLRVKLAAKILQQEIDRYREQHQDPLLKIASRVFGVLTLHSFSGLKADVDDRNEPVLVGIRPDGKVIKVEGMSDGTRDQLYLALRLAILEYRLEANEPMPFIVDDILVNFDDRRSGAALRTFSELADRNQVILFTHHQNIVDLAESLGSAADTVIHHLPA